MREYRHVPMLPELLLQDLRTRNGGQWSISRTRALMKIRMRDEKIRAEAYNQGRKDATNDAMGYGIAASERDAIRSEALKEAADRHCEVCHKTFPKKDGCEATCNRRPAILGEPAKVKI